jgi:hypothetical protein
VKELQPGEVAKFTVVRVADEIVVDLIKSACGIDYAEAAKDVVLRNLDGVVIPFASPRLLWRMKARTTEPKTRPIFFFCANISSREEKNPHPFSLTLRNLPRNQAEPLWR